MPTGYTATLYEGKPQTFEEFLFGCARAFGALVLMRDDPQDAPIPDEFEPRTDYHDERIAEGRAELRRLESITLAEAHVEAQAEYDAEVQRRREDRERREQIRERYEAMLDKARAWEPPTPEHVGLRKFMVEQLEKAIDFDCGDYHREPVQLLDAQEWVEKKRASAMRDIEYGTVEREKEIERAAGRTAWVKALRGSVGHEVAA